MSRVDRTNDSEVLGCISLVEFLNAKIMLINKGVKNTDAVTIPKIRLEFIKGFFTNGSAQRPQIKTPSILIF